MKKYKYTSPTPCTFSHEGKMYSLHHGEEYELPDFEFVETLVAQGRLVKVESTAISKKETSK